MSIDEVLGSMADLEVRAGRISSGIVYGLLEPNFILKYARLHS